MRDEDINEILKNKRDRSPLFLCDVVFNANKNRDLYSFDVVCKGDPAELKTKDAVKKNALKYSELTSSQIKKIDLKNVNITKINIKKFLGYGLRE